jgi:hypothetical protein
MLTEANQEKIVEAGGLGSLLNLLQSSEDETIRRVAAGAVANLAMNGKFLCTLMKIEVPFLVHLSVFQASEDGSDFLVIEALILGFFIYQRQIKS